MKKFFEVLADVVFLLFTVATFMMTFTNIMMGMLGDPSVPAWVKVTQFVGMAVSSVILNVAADAVLEDINGYGML